MQNSQIGGETKKKKVAFVCVHNSCRSQMAEAIAKLKYSECIEAYSAGTDISRGINEQAIAIIKKLYGVDISRSQSPKHINKLPAIDIVITMGCNVSCPIIESEYREDWGLEDPSGKGESDFLRTARAIESKMQELADRIKADKLS